MAVERIMIDEAFENKTYRVLSTPIKNEIPLKDWQKVDKDDFSWWDIKKEKEHIFSERKLRNQLKLSSDAAILEGMVFIKVSESRKVKDVRIETIMVELTLLWTRMLLERTSESVSFGIVALEPTRSLIIPYCNKSPERTAWCLSDNQQEQNSNSAK